MQKKSQNNEIFCNSQSLQSQQHFQLNFMVHKLHDVRISLIENRKLDPDYQHSHYWAACVPYHDSVTSIRIAISLRKTIIVEQYKKTLQRIVMSTVLFIKKPKLHINLLYKVSLYFTRLKERRIKHLLNCKQRGSITKEIIILVWQGNRYTFVYVHILSL